MMEQIRQQMEQIRQHAAQYAKGVLIGIDQLFNAILSGDPDETISSRIGKTKKRHGGKIPWLKYPVRFAVDWMLEKLAAGHSIKSIEGDEGHK